MFNLSVQSQAPLVLDRGNVHHFTATQEGRGREGRRAGGREGGEEGRKEGGREGGRGGRKEGRREKRGDWENILCCLSRVEQAHSFAARSLLC